MNRFDTINTSPHLEPKVGVPELFHLCLQQVLAPRGLQGVDKRCGEAFKRCGVEFQKAVQHVVCTVLI